MAPGTFVQTQRNVLALVLALLTACAQGPERGSVRKAQQWGSGLVFAEGGGGGGSALGEAEGLSVWLSFIGRKQEELRKTGVPEQEKRLGNRALAQMRVSLRGRSSEELRRQSPEAEYRRLKEEKAREEREEEARWAAVERKLDEYDAWAQQVPQGPGAGSEDGAGGQPPPRATPLPAGS